MCFASLKSILLIYNVCICSEDCHELLDECLDWTLQSQRPKDICSRLKEKDEDDPLPCISLESYLKPGAASTEESQGITSPCAKKPCNGSEVCILQRRNADVIQCINNHTDMTPLANAEQCKWIKSQKYTNLLLKN